MNQFLFIAILLLNVNAFSSIQTDTYLSEKTKNGTHIFTLLRKQPTYLKTSEISSQSGIAIFHEPSKLLLFFSGITGIVLAVKRTKK